MEFAKLRLRREWDLYICKEASNTEMGILGLLLSQDIEDNILPYKQTLDDNTLCARGGEFIFMEKENGYVLLSELRSEEAVPTEFKLSRQQFVQLLDDWQDKVCRFTPEFKPAEVIIKYDNDTFTIETNE
jgi:hypothetical protein